MKILVSLKRVPDADQKLVLDSTSINKSDVRWQTNAFDEYALEAALRLTEDPSRPGTRLGEVIVVTVGPLDAQIHLRNALAMGADRAIHVQADESMLSVPFVCAALMKIVRQEAPDLVLMGKLATDEETNAVGQRLAGSLNWPQATFACRIVLEADGKALQVGREVDAGVEDKRVVLPAVVTVDLRIISPQAIQNGITPQSHLYPEGTRYASLKGIRDAKNKPLVSMDGGALQPNQGAHTQTVGIEMVPARKSGILVSSATELVERLQNEAKVI